MSATEPHLLLDPLEDDHMRRAWGPENTRETLENSGFEILELDVVNDQTDHADPSIFTRVLAVKA